MKNKNKEIAFKVKNKDTRPMRKQHLGVIVAQYEEILIVPFSWLVILNIFLLTKQEKKSFKISFSNLKPGKAGRGNDIPTKIIKDFKDLFTTFI